MIGISVRLHSYGTLLLGRVYKILHIVAAVFSQHDGQRHAMVQVRAGIVGVGAVGIFAAGLLRCDPDVEDCGVSRISGQNIGSEYWYPSEPVSGIDAPSGPPRAHSMIMVLPSKESG